MIFVFIDGQSTVLIQHNGMAPIKYRVAQKMYTHFDMKNITL